MVLRLPPQYTDEEWMTLLPRERWIAWTAACKALRSAIDNLATDPDPLVNHKLAALRKYLAEAERARDRSAEECRG